MYGAARTSPKAVIVQPAVAGLRSFSSQFSPTKKDLNPRAVGLANELHRDLAFSMEKVQHASRAIKVSKSLRCSACCVMVTTYRPSPLQRCHDRAGSLLSLVIEARELQGGQFFDLHNNAACTFDRSDNEGTMAKTFLFLVQSICKTLKLLRGYSVLTLYLLQNSIVTRSCFAWSR